MEREARLARSTRKSPSRAVYATHLDGLQEHRSNESHYQFGGLTPTIAVCTPTLRASAKREKGGKRMPGTFGPF